MSNKQSSGFLNGDKVTVVAHYQGDVAGLGEVVCARPDQRGFLRVRITNGAVSPGVVGQEYSVQPCRLTSGHSVASL